MNTYRQDSQHRYENNNSRSHSIPTHLGFNRRIVHRLPENWRNRLPSPADYYAKNVEHLSRSTANGFAQGRCPFHDDGHSSLSVNVTDARGGWRCFAGCGGGDLVAFHMKRTGQDFRDAVASLLRGAA